MRYSYITILVLSLNAIQGSISNVKNDLPILDTSRAETENTGIPIIRSLLNYFQDKKQENTKEKNSVQNKAIVLKNEKILNIGLDIPSPKLPEITGSKGKDIRRHYLPMDPILKSLRNRRLWQPKHKKKESSSSSDTEMYSWLDDWHEKRLQQKFEALNSSQPRGDVVNLKRARPWGVDCGDPNQHDTPWGTCVLTEECDGEFRIYRGDLFCGKSQFVCCALMHTSYDMYQGLDLSFIHENSLSTDSDEEKRSENDKQKEFRDRKQQRKRIKRNKSKMKKRLRRSIKRVTTEITKLLQRAYRNQSAQQSHKKKELMTFIKKIKKQYIKDRQNLVNAHHIDLMKYDLKLEESLSKIHDMNFAYMNNETFRDIVVNGTVNKDNLLRLQKTHPVLSLFFKNRRMGGGDSEPETVKMKPETEEEELEAEEKNPKLFEYDLEYGMLYY